ncbi:MAG: TRAP transporter substrate-binding protein DctP [Candidatus Marinimicrobia bacterium]|nr:TRAP transporter substrate-binding protein DctP [Candidatus Neomarinimicrobiota bacterium]MBT4715308.1 TRAP transporter substrate-binding protein DctP [Candidatus Neomarinimicrobiota bacterium]MBT4946970.1 TRAP transporter substrate-binding protein DctP [Candidatus Neomarinimicrobiota bacterium]MBT5268401.1 TRAP transporter substrate-binding protein DctP [Candidatus Neomarinimicrobiota bacterium]MBT6011192.1 TRAP transporter substrate-binding protein DctP [Candidatus Neomarinimicrobiota bact
MMNNVRIHKVVMLVTMMTTLVWSQTVKLGSLAPVNSPWHETMLTLGEDWSNISEGKIKMKLYAGGILGDEADMVRKMRIGQLHAAALTIEGLMYIIPEIDVLRMPMMIQTDAELNHVRDELSEYLIGLLEERGFKLLSWSDAGWARLFTNAPVIYPEDLNKTNQIIFIWAGGSGKRGWMDAGYNAVEVAAPDIFMSLQTGLITTLTTTPIIALSYQWFPAVPFVTDLKAGPLPGAIIITKKKWNKISKEFHAPILKKSAERGQALSNEVVVLEKEAMRVMQENGLTLAPAPDDARAAWLEMVETHMYPEILEQEVPEELYIQVKGILEEFRSKSKE